MYILTFSKYKVILKTKEYRNKVCCFVFYQHYYSFNIGILVEWDILNVSIKTKRYLL